MYPIIYYKPSPPHIDADVTRLLLGCSWKAIPKCSASSYIIRWKRKQDDSNEWKECSIIERKFAFNLEEMQFSFLHTYECQVAVKVANDLRAQSRFSESCTFVLSELFGTSENIILKPPVVTVTSFRTLIVEWTNDDRATKYVIKCNNIKTGNSDIVYADQAQRKFENLLENHQYTFQVAVSRANGERGIWSRECFPSQPTMQLTIPLGTVVPHTGRQRIYTLNYRVTEFIYDIVEKYQTSASQNPKRMDDIFKALSAKLELDYETYGDGQLKSNLNDFVELFCDKLKHVRKRYQKIKPWECGSLFANLRVGRPLEADIALELVLDPELTQVEYAKCIDINSRETRENEEGTHLFFVSTNDRNWFSQTDLNEGKTESCDVYNRIRANETLTQFQDDVIECRDAICSSMPDGLRLLGIKKHKRGVCAVLIYKKEGLLVDLIPILRLPNFPHSRNPSRNMYDVHEPRYQAKRYREAMKCKEELKTDLFLLNEADEPYNQLDGAWSLTTSSIDHELLKLLGDDVKYAFRIVKYIMQMYVLEKRQDISKHDPKFFATSKDLTEEGLKDTYGLKTALPSHLLQIILIQLMVRTYEREEHDQLRGGTLILCLFDIFRKIVDSGHGEDLWFDAKKEMENSTTCGFEIRNINQLRKMVHKMSDPKELLNLVQSLLHRDCVPLVNWPLIDGAITVDVETISARDLAVHGEAMEMEDDLVSVKDDQKYSEKERTVFLKQPLDGSWIVCAVVEDIGEGKEPNTPIYLGICKMAQKFHFEKYYETASDIRDLQGSICKDLKDTNWFYPEKLRTNIQIDNESVIELQWQQSASAGKVKVTLTCAFRLPSVEGTFETPAEKDYVSFMILPHGMKIRYEARQCTVEHSEDDLEDDSLSTGYENVKRYLGGEACKVKFENANAMKVVRLPLKPDWEDEVAKVRRYTIGESSVKRPQKTIMLVGRIGAGKSTLIDAICNYIFDTKWEETTRMRIAVDHIDNVVNIRKNESRTELMIGWMTHIRLVVDQTDNLINISEDKLKTEWMTVYTISCGDSNRLPYTLRIIDTPGFGDTKDIKNGHQFVDQITALHRSGFDSLDAVCFVVKASIGQEIEKQRYILDYIVSLFDDNMTENLLMMITFANPSPSPVQNAIIGAGLPHGRNFLKFDNSVVFINNGLTEQDNTKQADKNDDRGTFLKGYWNIGKDRLKRFFEIVENLNAKHLSSKKLYGRQSIKREITLLQRQIQEGLRSIVILREKELALDQMKKTKCANTWVPPHNPYKSDESCKPKTVLDFKGHCKTCKCVIKPVETTVRKKITQDIVRHPDTDESFTGKLKRFVWGEDVNQRRYRELQAELDQEKKRENEERRLEYEYEKETEKKHQQYICNLMEKQEQFNLAIAEEHQLYCKKKFEVQNYVRKYVTTTEELSKLPPKPDPISFEEYIKTLIDTEQDDKKPGWEERIRELQNIKN